MQKGLSASHQSPLSISLWLNPFFLSIKYQHPGEFFKINSSFFFCLIIIPIKLLLYIIWHYKYVSIWINYGSVIKFL
jgi:hypothetical protein